MYKVLFSITPTTWTPKFWYCVFPLSLNI